MDMNVFKYIHTLYVYTLSLYNVKILKKNGINVTNYINVGYVHRNEYLKFYPSIMVKYRNY